MKKVAAGIGLAVASIGFIPIFLVSMMGPPSAPHISTTSSTCTVATPASNTSLAAEDVAKFAYAAGFRGDDLNIAVAVARAESNWNPKATLLNTNGSVDHGLFQINSVHAAILAEGNWSDPGDNAVMAFKVWTQAGGSWSPWVTYWRGTYQQYLTDVDPKPVCTPVTIAKGAWKGGKYANGRIPASALQALRTNPNHRLRADAADSFDKMSAAYAQSFGTPLCLTDSYRSLAAQIDVKRRKGRLAATPGTSNHGWGLAVDLCRPGTQAAPGPWLAGTEYDRWLHAHAGEFGWAHPSWAEPNGSKPESWHWEMIDKEHPL